MASSVGRMRTVHAAMDIQNRMLALLRATILFLGFVTCVTGEIRCYCNDASCVRTGYMCKSAMGRCFSQLTYERDSTRSIHGCAESLPLSDRDMCDGSGNIAEAKTGDRVQWPILLCCKEEMCNYMDNLDINIYVTRSNGSKDTSWPSLSEQRDFVQHGSAPYLVNTSQNELWFKAAVIAVPIAGGFILVLLVLLAVRVLRNDNRRHRQLMQMRHHRSLTKAQLYVADHFYQNELLSEMCPNCDGSQCPGHGDCVWTKSKSYPPRTSVKDPCLVHGTTVAKGGHREVRIKVDHSKNGYEKIPPVSDGSTFDDSYESVVIWGDPTLTETAAAV